MIKIEDTEVWGFSWGDILADGAGIVSALLFCIGVII